MAPESGIRSRRRRWLTRLIGVLALIAFLGSAYRYRPMSLLERSTRIVDVHDPYARGQRGASLTTVWVNDRRLALLRYPDDDKVEAEWLDVTTGGRAPAGDLMHALDPANAIPLFSPDGKWMLLTAQSAEKETLDRLFWRATTLDEKRFYEWFPADSHAFNAPSYSVQWLPDSRQVAEFLPLMPLGVQVHPPSGRPTDPLEIEIHDVVTGKETSLEFRVSEFIPPPEGDGYVARLLPGNRPLLARIDAANAHSERCSATFFCWDDSAHPDALPRSWSVTAPDGCVIRELQISPGGDRVAWVFLRRGPSALQALLHRILPSYPVPDELHLVIAVSALDGTQMRTLGELRLKDGDFRAYDGLPSSGVEWTPGGTRLAYTYRHILYTVAAD